MYRRIYLTTAHGTKSPSKDDHMMCFLALPAAVSLAQCTGIDRSHGRSHSSAKRHNSLRESKRRIWIYHGATFVTKTSEHADVAKPWHQAD